MSVPMTPGQEVNGGVDSAPIVTDSDLPPQRMCCLDPETPDHTHDASESSQETAYAAAWLLELAKSPGTVPPWAVSIARNQETLAAQQREMEAVLRAMLAKIDEIGDSVKPTIDLISNHPMGKMFGLGKK